MRAPEFWAAPPGLASWMLAPLGAAWQTAAHLRRAVARPLRAPVPVVCVGNLVAGGSGKTPVVLSLVSIATVAGVAAHVVTRGYRGRLPGPLRADPAKHDAPAVGDEALLIAARTPCWVARDRAAGIDAAAAAGAEIVVLDDGFQNPTIAPDLSLLVVDAEYGFGNGRVIPAGPLREPVAVGLARVGAIALLGGGDVPTALAGSGRPILRAHLRPIEGRRFAGSRVVAFAGIGRPAKFFDTLRGTGAELVAMHPFADHQRYSVAAIDRLRREAQQARACLVTTAKDWVRLPLSARDGIETLDVEVAWDDPAAVASLLTPLMHRVNDRKGDGNGRAAAHG